MFTLFSVLSLASGVAITTAVYSVVDAVMLRDLGVRDSHRAAFVVTASAGRLRPSALSAPDFEDLRREQRAFTSISASASIVPAVASTTHGELVAAEAIDGEYFTTLGITAARGRVIQQADNEAGARVVVLSDELWRIKFAADPQVVGRTTRIN